MAPDVIFEPDEIWESDRMNAALILGVSTKVIDEMTIRDVYILFARYNANQEIQNENAKN